VDFPARAVYLEGGGDGAMAARKKKAAGKKQGAGRKQTPAGRSAGRKPAAKKAARKKTAGKRSAAKKPTAADAARREPARVGASAVRYADPLRDLARSFAARRML
jgi:hypothetical protein